MSNATKSWIITIFYLPEYTYIFSIWIYVYDQTIYYRQISNIRRTLAGNKIVDHADVVGASPVGAAPTTSSFST